MVLFIIIINLLRKTLLFISLLFTWNSIPETSQYNLLFLKTSEQEKKQGEKKTKQNTFVSPYLKCDPTYLRLRGQKEGLFQI